MSLGRRGVATDRASN